MKTKKYYLGTSGWNYPHWKNNFYPEDIKKKDWFNYYLENFNTIEINYPFYKWPSEETFDKWYNQCPAGFKMTLKAPKMITHLKKLKDVEGFVNDFYNLTSRLKEKLGCHLFQLPSNIKFNQNNFEKLKNFVKILNSRKDNAIEFRDKGRYRKEVFDLLEKNKIGFVTVSGLEMPSDFIPGKITYIRFHGDNQGGDYSKKTLREYAQKIKKTKDCKIYVYFNNDEKGYAPKNALKLKEILETKKSASEKHKHK